MKSYLTAVEAKLSQLVNKTFCYVPIEGINCCYLDRLTFEASTAQCKPTKNVDPTIVG